MTTKRAREIIKRNKHEFGMIDDDFGDAIKVLFEASKKLDQIKRIIDKANNVQDLDYYTKADAVQDITSLLKENKE